MIYLKKIDINILIFLGIAIFILWQMLLPGYIIGLDMVFTPKLKIIFPNGNFYDSLPILYFQKSLNLVLPGWAIQKIFLFSLFFLLLYLPFKFLPLPKKYYLNYWGAIFYCLNPFVYERMLAGHWRHLFGYALIPPFLYYLMKFVTSPPTPSKGGFSKDSFLMFLWLFLIGIFSFHYFVICFLIMLLYILAVLSKEIFTATRTLNTFSVRVAVKKIKYFFIPFLVFLIISSYWIIPYFTHKNSNTLEMFNQQNLEAFKTAGDERLGTAVNVLALYGFWAEDDVWAGYFLWPKEYFFTWIIFLIIFLFVISGVYFLFKNKEKRGEAIFFLILGICGYVFSCGIGGTVFKGLNQFMFDHIGFWRGFRDTNKFSGFLALAYIYFASWGIYFFLDKLKSKKYINQWVIGFFLLPVLFTYTMPGGFARQLKPVWYPEQWSEVNNILNQDTGSFKVLVLPWHQYMSLPFNFKLISGNPAQKYFDKEIIQGENMELGSIFNQKNKGANNKIEKVIINPFLSNDEKVKELKNYNIKYIININGIEKDDILLKSPLMENIYISPEISLFKFK